MRLISCPVKHGLSGRLKPPGDKSISHRAAILGGLARGRTRIEGFLEADDTLATLHAMSALGADVQHDRDQVEITGQKLHSPRMDMDLGNSGTGMRLLTGVLSGHPDLFGQRILLTGDRSLCSRPMGRIIKPLSRMGAQISSRNERAPLMVEPRPLTGHAHRLSIASAQVKSAILLAGLQAQGMTQVMEPGISRDHTERMLPAFGVQIQSRNQKVDLTGPQTLTAARIQVPADLSSAAFLIAAALIVPDSEIDLSSIGMNPSRSGFIQIMQRMAEVSSIQQTWIQQILREEPVANLKIRFKSQLSGMVIPAEMVPLAIDEFPILMAMAACASGETVITGAAELRVKESDRLAVMCAQLQRLGVALRETSDGAVISGGAIRGGRVDAEGDHRIAMSLAVLGLVAEAPVEIENAEWIRTSYPEFDQHLNHLGGDLAWADDGR